MHSYLYNQDVPEPEKLIVNMTPEDKMRFKVAATRKGKQMGQITRELIRKWLEEAEREDESRQAKASE